MEEKNKQNKEDKNTIIREVVDRGSLPSRLFGYYGGILGGNVGGLMTKQEKKE